MLVVIIQISVKADCLEAFRDATIANARESLREPGIAQFDFLQQVDDPTRFTLIEAYRDADAPAKHKETSHYQTWRDTVAPMMAEPRSSLKFSNIYPPDEGW